MASSKLFLTIQDKNPKNKVEAEENFKIIAEAYEVLSDEKKRATYDKYGKAGLQPGGGGTGGSDFVFDGFHGFGGFGSGGGSHFSFKHAEDIFKDFFGGRDPFAGFMDDDDDFFGDFGRRGKQHSSKTSKHDPFGAFGGFGFGGMGGFSSFGGMGGFDDDDFFGGSGGGFSGGTSIKTSTVIKNGERITKTEKSYIDSNGNKKTEIT